VFKRVFFQQAIASEEDHDNVSFLAIFVVLLQNKESWMHIIVGIVFQEGESEIYTVKQQL
jgi:hypothetical protein